MGVARGSRGASSETEMGPHGGPPGATRGATWSHVKGVAKDFLDLLGGEGLPGTRWLMEKLVFHRKGQSGKFTSDLNHKKEMIL